MLAGKFRAFCEWKETRDAMAEQRKAIEYYNFVEPMARTIFAANPMMNPEDAFRLAEPYMAVHHKRLKDLSRVERFVK